MDHENTGWGKAQLFTHPATQIQIAKLLPGNYYLSRQDLVISTVLGSCVCACIHDPQAGLGGMNHYMLPGSIQQFDKCANAGHPSANRYGQEAMDNLIAALLAKGASKERLQIKLFGGGHVLDIQSSVSDENASFGLDYCSREQLQLLSHNLGDEFPRKVNFNPITGRVRMQKLRAAYTGMVAGNESKGIEGL